MSKLTEEENIAIYAEKAEEAYKQLAAANEKIAELEGVISQYFNIIFEDGQREMLAENQQQAEKIAAGKEIISDCRQEYAAAEEHIKKLEAENQRLINLLWQQTGGFHPYTCGNDSQKHRPLFYHSGQLFCHDCDYEQSFDLAHVGDWIAALKESE